jgi:hypothetical protein
LLIAENCKYLLNCLIVVAEPNFDDVIAINTVLPNQIGCVSFKLTNTTKQAAPFKAYFLTGYPDLQV